MAQHDMNIANQGFPATRADLNNALQALASNNSGTSAPSTTFANQWWYDTQNNKLYIRNEANNAWIQVAVLDQTNNEWQITTGVIQAKDSDGLALKTDDGTTRLFIKDSDGSIGIGTSSPSAFSNFTNVTLQGGSAGVNLDFKDSGGNRTHAIVSTPTEFIVETGNTDPLIFKTNNAERIRIQAGGGISFNGDTAAANALDDYEEGSWTPVLTGITVASGTLDGTYRKIGGLVSLTMRLENATLTGTHTGSKIEGLPFTCGKRTSSSMPVLYNHANGDKPVGILIEGGTSLAYFQYNTTGAWVAAPFTAGANRYLAAQMVYNTSA